MVWWIASPETLIRICKTTRRHISIDGGLLSVLGVRKDRRSLQIKRHVAVSDDALLGCVVYYLAIAN